MYSKSDEQGNNKIINYVKQQIDAGNLVDASIKKTPIWFTTRGLQLPKVVQTIIDANNTVPQKVQTVNNNDMQKDKKDNTKYSRALSSETKEKLLNSYDIVNLMIQLKFREKFFRLFRKTDSLLTKREQEELMLMKKPEWKLKLIKAASMKHSATRILW